MEDFFWHYYSPEIRTWFKDNLAELKVAQPDAFEAN